MLSGTIEHRPEEDKAVGRGGQEGIQTTGQSKLQDADQSRETAEQHTIQCNIGQGSYRAGWEQSQRGVDP